MFYVISRGVFVAVKRFIYQNFAKNIIFPKVCVAFQLNEQILRYFYKGQATHNFRFTKMVVQQQINHDYKY